MYRRLGAFPPFKLLVNERKREFGGIGPTVQPSKADEGRCSGRECQVEIGTRNAMRVTPSLTVTWRRLFNVGVRQCGVR